MLNYNDVSLTKEEAAQILKTTPELLKEFEESYLEISDKENSETDNYFKINSRDAARKLEKPRTDKSDLINRIVNELLTDTEGYPALPSGEIVTNEEIASLPIQERPQLTGHLIQRQISEPSYPALLLIYKMWLDTGDKTLYNIFRHGLDIQDLDPIVYAMLGTNPNSMGYWLSALKNGAEAHGFFKIPETKIVKVPLPILQLTRLEYFSLTPATLEVVDRWAEKAFNLDPGRTYFIKTGTYSSKFDFRNAKVTTPPEVKEIGRYLLFIHSQANAMAHYDLSGRGQPCIYGVSTTNEWVVREYIENSNNLPCIYHGLPLRTEYRAFIDFDNDEIMGMFPYWDPELMKKRFSKGADADTADMKHDYIIFLKEEDRLNETFEKNKAHLMEHIREMLPDIPLKGQWSLDIMQDGNDFWLIDMAIAARSALVEKLPVKLDLPEEDWLPLLPR